MVYLLIVIFSLSSGLTCGLKKYALAKNIMDVPNHRSSHTRPTPRGGGVAFVAAVLVSIPILNYLGIASVSLSMALIGGGLAVALLGFYDDRRTVPPYVRLLGHFLASAFAVYCLGEMPGISIFGMMISNQWLLCGLAMIYLVWLLNLYNFMDGIDGLAAIEAICVAVGGAFLYWLNGDYTAVVIPLILAAAVAGFLWWNFPPARIFMGDAGSGFLGLILGILSIQAATIQMQFFWCWLILLGVFIVDATVTLLSHFWQGIKVYEAHCDHAYQHATRHFGSHFRVSMGILTINIFWLFPMAILTYKLPFNVFIGLLIAYLPLVILAFKFKAGQR